MVENVVRIVLLLDDLQAPQVRTIGGGKHALADVVLVEIVEITVRPDETREAASFHCDSTSTLKPLDRNA